MEPINFPGSICASKPPLICEHTVSSPEDYSRYRIHSEFEIFLFLQGDVEYVVEQSVYPLVPGDILLLNSSELHYPVFLSDMPFERISIHFCAARIQQLSTPQTPLLHRFLLHPPGKGNLIRLNAADLSRFRTLALQISRECRSSHWGDDILAVTHLAEVLILMENGKNAEGTTEQLSENVEKALSYIDRTLPRPISLSDVAAELNLDRFCLNKLFKREMGTTVYNYILLKRLNWSRTLLLQGASVGDACTGSGFNDYTNFIRTFKKYTGVTPSAYARMAPNEQLRLTRPPEP